MTKLAKFSLQVSYKLKAQGWPKLINTDKSDLTAGHRRLDLGLQG